MMLPPLCAVALLSQAAPTDLEFVESFETQPAGPLAFADPRFDVVVHSRDKETFASLEPVFAQHGLDCSPPPAQHTVTAYEDAVYSCKGHLMTAIEAEGYGVVYLTPTALVDFSSGESVVQVDVSTLRTSGRDWWDLYLSPYEDHLVAPLEEWLPDLQGQPRRAVHLRMNFGSPSRFLLSIWEDGVETELTTLFAGYEDWLVPDPKQRQTFELRISKNSLAFGMPGFDTWWYDGPIPELSFESAVLQLGHHSYNPAKEDVPCPGGHDPSLAGLVCGDGNTWHWDELRISSATPFTRIAGDRRSVSSLDANRVVRLNAPAPPDAELRFSGIGAIELAFDGGSFLPAVRRDGSLEAAGQHDPGHFASYLTPIPAGTREVEFRFADEAWWDFEKLARDISVWSLSTAGSGCVASGGGAPELSVPAALVGDAGFAIGLLGGVPASPAFFAVSTGELAPESLGCGVGLDLSPGALVVPSPGLPGSSVTDSFGASSLALPLLVSPSLVGLDLAAQAFVLDPGAELDLGPIQFAATAVHRFAIQ